MRDEYAEKSALTDIFFDIYQFAKISGEIYDFARFTDQQQLSFKQDYAYIHIVQQATCRLKVANTNLDLVLKTGDIIVLPSAGEHTIELLDAENQAAAVISCIFKLSGIYGEAIIEGLPRYIHVPSHNAADKVAEWIPMTVTAIKLELEHPSLGSQVMLSRIIDLLLVWSIRFWLAKATIEHKSWIVALRDPAISKALSLMHDRPAYAWDVENLAQSTYQSRSSFAKKFVELVGVSPIQYLKNWRMRLAGRFLKETDKNIFQIAELVGYSSQAAFTRAFTQTYGCAPKVFRASLMQNDQ